MAILSPADLPVVLKLNQAEINSMKKYVMSKLGYGVVDVEVTEDQLESALRTACDFIAMYFPREQKLTYFYTQPLVPTYAMPEDAYWIQEVSWDVTTTNLSDVFGAEYYLFNIGSVSGVPQLLFDYHLLQSYRRFSQQILATYGSWEVVNEGGDGPDNQRIRLYPTPKGTFPVVVVYYPYVTHFRSPQARMLANDMLLAETMIMVGQGRRKISSFPSPDGGSITLDGEALVSGGNELRDKVMQRAILWGEPLGLIKR